MKECDKVCLRVKKFTKNVCKLVKACENVFVLIVYAFHEGFFSQKLIAMEREC